MKLEKKIYYKPNVAIIMSVFNEESRLSIAIKSILNQSYSSWRLIIVNDGCTDNSQDVIDHYLQEDERISCIINQYNQGLAYSLNQGINYCDTMYIARMDADDIAHSRRLEKQMAFIELHPAVDVLGVGANVSIPGSEIKNVVIKPRTHMEILQTIEKKNPFFHSSVVMKKSFIDELGGYDEKCMRAQDYDLWFRGVDNSTYHNLTEPLMDYFSRNQSTKSILYGFRVRIINAFRRDRIISGISKALMVLVYGFVLKAKRFIIRK